MILSAIQIIWHLSECPSAYICIRKRFHISTDGDIDIYILWWQTDESASSLQNVCPPLHNLILQILPKVNVGEYVLSNRRIERGLANSGNVRGGNNTTYKGGSRGSEWRLNGTGICNEYLERCWDNGLHMGQVQGFINLLRTKNQQATYVGVWGHQQSWLEGYIQESFGLGLPWYSLQ